MNDVAPIATELKSTLEIEQSKMKQQKQIEQIQERLTDEEKSALITEAEAEDPEGNILIYRKVRICTHATYPHQASCVKMKSSISKR